MVLARVLEVVWGLEFGELLRRRVLEPLGLASTRDRGSSTAGVPGLVRGHDPVGITGLRRSRPFDDSILVGASSLVSTAKDLLRWCEALAHGSEAVGGGALERIREIYAESVAGRPALVLAGWDGVGFGARAWYFPGSRDAVIVR